MNLPTSRKIIITGATGALGTQVIKKLVEQDYQVTGTYHSKSPADIHEPSLSGSHIKWIELNLASSESVKSQIGNQAYDILIHCAGGFRFGKIEEFTDADLEFLLDINLKSSFFLAREILPGMKKRNFGRIVFISSEATLHPSSGMGAYVATKAGLNALTQVLTEETKSFNISVNAVLPSIIDTPTNRQNMPNAKFSDWVNPKQIAEIISTLISPWGDPIRGALIPVSGRL